MLESTPIDVSEKYVVIPTPQIIGSLEEVGFKLASYKTGTHKSGKEVVRMRWPQPMAWKGETLFPEIVIHNSYNGRHRFRLKMGVFRLVCTNGLVLTVVDLDNITITHRGGLATLAQQVVMAKAKSMPKMTQVVEKMHQRVLSDQEKIDYALACAEKRWNQTFTEAQAAKLLVAARPEDNNLWGVFNTLQENILQTKINPGVKRLRAITNPDRFEEVNEFIFEKAYAYV